MLISYVTLNIKGWTSNVNGNIIQDAGIFLRVFPITIHNINFTPGTMSLVIKRGQLVRFWHRLPHSGSVDIGYIGSFISPSANWLKLATGPVPVRE